MVQFTTSLTKRIPPSFAMQKNEENRRLWKIRFFLPSRYFQRTSRPHKTIPLSFPFGRSFHTINHLLTCSPLAFWLLYQLSGLKPKRAAAQNGFQGYW
jgi:hypothetical protein